MGSWFAFAHGQAKTDLHRIGILVESAGQTFRSLVAEIEDTLHGLGTMITNI